METGDKIVIHGMRICKNGRWQKWKNGQIEGTIGQIVQSTEITASTQEIQAHDDPRPKVYDPSKGDWFPEEAK
jgi:hypothetical protein